MDFMKEALNEAKKGIKNKEGGPFGAVIVKDGKIIGRGHNQVIKLNDPTAHAEIQAIRDACKNINSFSLEGATIYTTCEPCPMCFGAIHWARISKVVYALTKEDAAKIGFDDSLLWSIMQGKRKPVFEYIKIEYKEAKEVFEEWYNSPDKILY
jgi:guanine deaminase